MYPELNIGVLECWPMPSDNASNPVDKNRGVYCAFFDEQPSKTETDAPYLTNAKIRQHFFYGMSSSSNSIALLEERLIPINTVRGDGSSQLVPRYASLVHQIALRPHVQSDLMRLPAISKVSDAHLIEELPEISASALQHGISILKQMTPRFALTSFAKDFDEYKLLSLTLFHHEKPQQTMPKLSFLSPAILESKAQLYADDDGDTCVRAGFESIGKPNTGKSDNNGWFIENMDRNDSFPSPPLSFVDILNTDVVLTAVKTAALKEAKIIRFDIREFETKATTTKRYGKSYYSDPSKVIFDAIQETSTLLNASTALSSSPLLQPAVIHQPLSTTLASSTVDIPALLTILHSKFDDCDIQIMATPMDVFSSKRVKIPQHHGMGSGGRPSLFFPRIQTAHAIAVALLKNTTMQQSSTATEFNDNGDGCLLWNPYVMLMEYLAMRHGNGSRAPQVWEDIGEFSDWSGVGNFDGVLSIDDIVGYCGFDDYHVFEVDDEELFVPLFRHISVNVELQKLYQAKDHYIVDGIDEFSAEELDEFDTTEWDQRQDFNFANPNHINSKQSQHRQTNYYSETTQMNNEKSIDKDRFRHKTSHNQDDFHPQSRPSSLLHAIHDEADGERAEVQVHEIPSIFHENSKLSDSEQQHFDKKLRNIQQTPIVSFFSAKQAVDSFMNLRQVKSQVTKNHLHPQTQQPPQKSVRLPAQRHQSFISPYALENFTLRRPPTSEHLYIAGARVIRNPKLLALLEDLKIELIERDYGEINASGTIEFDRPVDFDFIIDERTCIILCPAIFIFQKNTIRTNGANGRDQSTAGFDESGLYATLLKLSIRFSNVYLIVDLATTARTATDSGSGDGLAALTNVVQNISTAMAGAAIEWSILARTFAHLKETARLVREIGDDAATRFDVLANATGRMTADVPKPWASKEGWESRSWLSAEESAVRNLFYPFFH
ncbi:hypothetical protein HK100_010768 [Physocladia obscura]|uniref:Uncharacterized protein n=1 Tax=Physocladia obscura TaxID=109957 RepID=A0AAD5T284_9FUNG|nr:hypothetical protein HK100_010768 [Physocladia obscura]